MKLSEAPSGRSPGFKIVCFDLPVSFQRSQSGALIHEGFGNHRGIPLKRYALQNCMCLSETLYSLSFTALRNNSGVPQDCTEMLVIQAPGQILLWMKLQWRQKENNLIDCLLTGKEGCKEKRRLDSDSFMFSRDEQKQNKPSGLWASECFPRYRDLTERRTGEIKSLADRKPMKVI